MTRVDTFWLNESLGFDRFFLSFFGKVDLMRVCLLEFYEGVEKCCLGSHSFLEILCLEMIHTSDPLQVFLQGVVNIACYKLIEIRY